MNSPAIKITSFIGLAIGIGLTQLLGSSGILTSALFGGIGGAIGGAIGAVIDHKGWGNIFTTVVDNLLAAILFFLPGVLIGSIITASIKDSISGATETLIILGCGIVFSFIFTRRKIKKKHTVKNIFDDENM